MTAPSPDENSRLFTFTMSKLVNQAQTINKLITEANVLRRIAKAGGSISFNYGAKTLQLLPLCGGSLQISQEGFDPQRPVTRSGNILLATYSL